VTTRAAANGLELCYEVHGDEADEPMLLIHGHGAQLIAWHEDLLDQLVGLGFYVLTFDNRDAGLSTHLEAAPVPDAAAVVAGEATPPYVIDDMADDAASLLDALGIEAAHVLGVSMGGMIAQEVAIGHQGKVRSLTSVMSSPDPVRVGTPTTEVLEMMTEPGATTREGVIEQSLASWRRTGSVDLGLDEAWMADIAGRQFDRAFDPDGVGRQFAAIVGSRDRRPGLASVTVPTLVVHGAIDPIVTLAGGKATADAVPGATLVAIDKMGHDLPKAVWPQLLDAVHDVTKRA
jgi:pimeloyl-ACP methyl ester carboxylesterase